MTVPTPQPHTKPRLSLTVPGFGTFLPRDGLARVIDIARAAETAGFDGLKFIEHVVLGADTQTFYWREFPYPADVPWLEPLVTMAAVAAVTHRIALQTGIVIAPLRPAVILAKQAATLDVLSGGRLTLGVGPGWQPAELEAGGVPFEQRGARLTETMAACRVLWRDSPASFSGRYVNFQNIYCEPRPSAGTVPVWFAGPLHAKTLRRVVDHGDGWIAGMADTAATLPADIARLREELVRAGRPPEIDVAISAPVELDVHGRPSIERSLEAARELGEKGVTVVSVLPEAYGCDADGVMSWIVDVARRWSEL